MAKVRQVVVYGNYFFDFYNKQTQKVRERIDWTINIIKDLDFVPEKYLKHLTGTDLYEIRVSSGSNIFRIFCFFDKGKIVILLNGFQKKSQKTPSLEIARAEKLKRNYYEDKKK